MYDWNENNNNNNDSGKPERKIIKLKNFHTGVESSDRLNTLAQVIKRSMSMSTLCTALLHRKIYDSYSSFLARRVKVFFHTKMVFQKNKDVPFLTISFLVQRLPFFHCKLHSYSSQCIATRLKLFFSKTGTSLASFNASYHIFVYINQESLIDHCI